MTCEGMKLFLIAGQVIRGWFNKKPHGIIVFTSQNSADCISICLNYNKTLGKKNYPYWSGTMESEQIIKLKDFLDMILISEK